MDEGEDDHAYSLYAHNNMLVFLDALDLSLIHIYEHTRPLYIAY